MRVLMVEPGTAPYEMEINGLEEMQAAVGGRITASYPFEEQVALVSNEESIWLQMPFNRLSLIHILLLCRTKTGKEGGQILHHLAVGLCRAVIDHDLTGEVHAVFLQIVLSVSAQLQM